MQTIKGLIKPEKGEYPAFYQKYIDLVIVEDILDLFKKQHNFVHQYFGSIDTEKSRESYAPGKWTFREMLGHIIDTEKMMHFRALMISRGDSFALPGFDQDHYVEAADFNRLDLDLLLSAFDWHRKSLMSFMLSASEGDWVKKGSVRGEPMSVRALIFIIPGHLEHHFRVLKEKYKHLL